MAPKLSTLKRPAAALSIKTEPKSPKVLRKPAVAAVPEAEEKPEVDAVPEAEEKPEVAAVPEAEEKPEVASMERNQSLERENFLLLARRLGRMFTLR